MVRTRSDLLKDLHAIGDEDSEFLDLGEAALLLGALDHPEISLDPYRAHLRDITAAMAAATSASDSVGLQLNALRQVLVHQYGYQGDTETYDDPRNANLIDVIDRRKGLPVALGILFLHAGRSYGAGIVGLNFPSHFLVRLMARGQRVIIDPFHGGNLVAPEELRQRIKEVHGPQAEMEPLHYSDMTDRDVLIRLQNNIKLRAIAAGELERGLAVLDSMIALAPGRAELWWETAVLHSRLGNVKTAIRTLETALEAGGEPAGRDQLEDLLRRLRGRMN